MKRKLESNDDKEQPEKKLKTPPLQVLELQFIRASFGGGRERIKLQWVYDPRQLRGADTQGRAWEVGFDPDCADGVSAKANKQQMEILGEFFGGHPIARIIQGYAQRPYGCDAWVVCSKSKSMIVIRGLFLDCDEALNEWLSWNAFHGGGIDHASVQHVFAEMHMVTIPEFSIPIYYEFEQLH